MADTTNENSKVSEIPEAAGNVDQTNKLSVVWNKHVDVIPVNKNNIIEPGYAYIFDGENYKKSEEVGDCRFFGFDTDTYSSEINPGEGNTIKVPVAGFLLAYVDSAEYRPGTALTCGPGGILTKLEDDYFKSDPRPFIATFWKKEYCNIITDGTRIVKTNGRHWVKVR